MNFIEKEYVHNTYQKIAEHFSNTRAYVWKSVKEFLKKVESNSIILEVGCGNGKNLNYRKDCINLGCDLCKNFCSITNRKGAESLVANNLYLPFTDNSIEYILSIAVIHHLSTRERRMKSIYELIRILSPGGKLLIQVWAMKQPDNSRRKFTKQDNLVEFQSSDKKIKELRFYHVFEENELEEMINNIPGIKIVQSYWEIGNWILVIEKIK
jgi:ubiquinone/menaquinone biosynthesis C-methylase UbiE